MVRGSSHKEAPATSDPDRSRIPSRDFIGMIEGSKANGDYVLLEYGEDHYVELVKPEMLSMSKVYPRFALEDSYAGKERLEAGMEVRLRWNNKYTRCKATVVAAGGNYKALSDQFDHMNSLLVEQGQRKAQSKLRKRERLTQGDATATRQIQRAKLVLDSVERVSPVREVSADVPPSVGNLDIEPGWENETDTQVTANTGTEVTEDSQRVMARRGRKHSLDETNVSEDGYESQRVQHGESNVSESIDELREKRAKYLRKAAYYAAKIKKASPNGITGVRVAVPKVSWTFDMADEDIDKGIYKKLEKSANIWVVKSDLLRVQGQARDMKSYATKLMWDILIPPNERVNILDVKVTKAGFVKLFGSSRIDSVYQHLLEFQRGQIKKNAGRHWEIPLKPKSEVRRLWAKSFNGRIASAKASTKRI